MRYIRYTLLLFLLSTLLTGCVVIIKNYGGHHNNINKTYEESDVQLDQDYDTRIK